ncbi:MAG: precorrin-6y C5,15-methyltransferase (decarboxylating) subunit CbiE [Desulforhopalus sp.]
MSKLFILGIAEPILSAEQESILAACTLVVGTKRLIESAAHLPCRFMAITPLAAALATIRTVLEEGNVGVLASGDPLFYGIGRRLLAEFPEDTVQVYPALSSIQRACALFKIPWDGAKITSLHGRNSGHIPGLLLRNSKNLVLTDTHNSPDRIAFRLLDYLQLIGATVLPDAITVLVAEDLGLPSQKIFRGTLIEATQQQFSPLNILCLLVPKTSNTHPYRFGLTEDLIHHSRGLITKNEVRAATLHQLQLPGEGVLWDIGAGSGSLSIEAARQNPKLTVYAVEHKKEELENIKNNIVKFGCYNIVPVFGRAPEVLADLTAPDRVFIGGSSGSLPSIVAFIAKHLPGDGRLVINGVIKKTVQAAPRLMTEHGFSVTSSVVKITRTEPNGSIRDFNPITIMTGTR